MLEVEGNCTLNSYASVAWFMWFRFECKFSRVYRCWNCSTSCGKRRVSSIFRISQRSNLNHFTIILTVISFIGKLSHAKHRTDVSFSECFNDDPSNVYACSAISDAFVSQKTLRFSPLHEMECSKIQRYRSHYGIQSDERAKETETMKRGQTFDTSNLDSMSLFFLFVI